MAWKVTSAPDRFAEALAWFKARVPMSADAYYALEAHARDKAFTVSHVSQMDVVQLVLDKIQAAIATGQSLQDFSKEVTGALTDAWAGKVKNPAFRIETIFRTNTATAFSRGRQLQMDSPVVQQIRPWRLFDDTRDARESDICRSCGGTLVRFDDPWLDTHTPPLHFNCRSHIRALRDEQAAKIEKRPIPRIEPSPGFGIKPTLANTKTTRLKPDLPKYDRKLAELAKKKDRKKRPPPPPPPSQTNPKHDPTYWLPEYGERYGDAAQSFAHGRAMLERGRSMTLADLEAATKRYSEFWPKARELRQSLRREIYGAGKSSVMGQKTVGEVLDRLTSKRAFGFEQKRAAKIAALAATHAHRIEVGGTAKIVDAKLRVRDAQAIEAMAQGTAFYRALGGSKLAFKQASAEWTPNRGKYNYDDNHIRFGRVTTYVHEVGHQLDNQNPRIAKRAGAFLAVRGTNKKIVKLSKLTGNADYKADEVAYDDEFIKAYMGRLYSPWGGDVTEITSMGMEWLFQHPDTLMARDSDYFLFALGQLAG